MKHDSLALGALTASLYAATSRYLLSTGHPAEDAYILFQYAEHLGNGQGITFYEGGPPIEGATSFLWMVALAGAHVLGVDVAWAAALLNAVGLGVIAYVGATLVPRSLPNPPAGILPLGFALLLLCSPMARAGYAGFETCAYSAIVTACIALLLRGSPEELVAIPALGLLLGLVRPDGLTIGIPYTVLTLPLVWRSPARGRYLFVTTLTAGLGFLYFVWRFEYFGHLLPLPLYVKGQSPVLLPGLGRSLRWAVRVAPILPVAAYGVTCVPRERTRLLIASSGPLCLLVFLLFGINSQDWAHRLRAPTTTLLLLLGLRGTAHLLVRRRPREYGFALLPFAVIAWFYLHHTTRRVHQLQHRTYHRILPYLLRDAIPSHATIALTEAGAFSYWTRGKTYDLVGLNTPRFALHGASPDDLEALAPDLIFVHTSWTIDSNGCGGPPICILDAGDLEAMRSGSWFSDVSWDELTYGAYRAPLATYGFLERHPDEYTIALVPNGSPRAPHTFVHLYAIRRDGAVDADVVLHTLAQSLETKKGPSFAGFSGSFDQSYLDLKARR